MSEGLPDLPRGTPLGRISAPHIRSWNRAAEFERRSRIRPLPAADGPDVTSTVVKVRNKTYETVGRFGVLVLSEPTIEPAENLDHALGSPCMDAVAPGTPEDYATLVILIDPLQPDRIGRAVLHGAAWAQVYVSDEENWQFADVDEGNTTNLVMAHYGPARILWKEPGTGLKWAYVQLGGRPLADGWIATDTKTSSYTAKPGEAVVVSLASGNVTIALPPWGDLPANVGNVAIDVIYWLPSPGIRNAVVGPDGSDKINGSTGQWMLEDMSSITDTGGGTSGGRWVFWRTGNSDIQWSCSRRLVLPPP